ncbi:hypothetical protein BB560_001299 [Smittium megazygosporum]|uniref:Micro-fibrillar-associated protein 1 C-terminal domain-containing protein n=1 Tax=Smittium megazygosporum TaxID=133381 RepID=A0A2T9ZHY4_9FUNG|nr:hypothetical protein BB560_001299 [Smittium megazygosporum]
MSSKQEKKPTKLVPTSGTKVTRYYAGKAPEIKDNLSDSEYESEFEEEIKTEESKVIISSFKAINRSEESLKDKELLKKRLEARKTAASGSESEEDSNESNESGSESSGSGEEESSLRLESRERLRQRLLLKQKEVEFIEESSEESSEEESDSSEYESEDSITTMQRPVFVSKSQRQSKLSTTSNHSNTEIIRLEEKEIELENRRKETLKMASLQIQQELELEYEQWKSREIARIKRDKDLREAQEKELIEIEKRRKMTDSEILKMDKEHFEKQNKLKEEKRKLGINTQNHHMGAFFNDVLQDKHITEKYASTVEGKQNVKDLPEVLKQVRSRNYGKHSQTKWKGLKSEDTSKSLLEDELYRKRARRR